MQSMSQLWLFFLVVLGVVILPGLDMAFVLASSLVGGRRSGLVAVGGIVAGGACHVLACGLGVGLLLRLVPTLFNAVLLGGALYIAWIGWSLLRSQVALGAIQSTTPRSLGATFRQAALTNLLNPKAYLFMLAVFPQFLGLDYGPLWLQALVLGLIIAVTQIGVYGSLALAAAQARNWLDARPQLGVWMARVVGAGLVLAAVLTGWQGWQRL